MHTLPSIFLGSFLIAFSGAMMPGPMLMVTVGEAARRGFWAGPLVVLGHGLLELLLMVGLLLGLSTLFRQPLFTAVVGVAGGGILIWMAWGMLRGLRTLTLQVGTSELASGGPVVGGVITSLSNPYWTLWWATVGLSYLTLTAGTGWPGTAAFFTGHILADLVWFSLVSALLHFGRRILDDRWYRRLVGVCAVVLVGFGVLFLRSGVRALLGMA